MAEAKLCFSPVSPAGFSWSPSRPGTPPRARVTARREERKEEARVWGAVFGGVWGVRGARPSPPRGPAPTSAPRSGRVGRTGEGLRRGGGCHSGTHAGGMQTAGLPCGHVSAPPTEVGAQVPSLWALGARQAADERLCRLTLSWPHPLPAASCRVVANHEGQRGGRLERRLGAPANEWASGRWRGVPRSSPTPPTRPTPLASGLSGSRADTPKRQVSQ